MRHIIHWALNAIGVVTWFVAMSAMWVTIRLSVLGHRLWPEADKGNCWTYALPRWYLHGGYLSIRWANGARIFGRRIPHVIWLHEIPADTPLQQTEPLRRSKGRRLPPVFYFRFRVVTKEHGKRD